MPWSPVEKATFQESRDQMSVELHLKAKQHPVQANADISVMHVKISIFFLLETTENLKTLTVF